MSKIYKLTLINEKKELHETIDIMEGISILEGAAEADIILPFLCKTGDCYSCVCKITSGSVQHTTPNILDQQDLDNGYILACSAYLTSDCIIETHKEKEFARYRRSK